MIFRVEVAQHPCPYHVVQFSPGVAEGILVWYGQQSGVQFTRGGVVAEPKCFGNLDHRSVYFIDSRGTWGKKWYGQYRSDRTVSDAPDACSQTSMQR